VKTNKLNQWRRDSVVEQAMGKLRLGSCIARLGTVIFDHNFGCITLKGSVL